MSSKHTPPYVYIDLEASLPPRAKGYRACCEHAQVSIDDSDPVHVRVMCLEPDCGHEWLSIPELFR